MGDVKKISELNPVTELETTDEFVVVDKSAITGEDSDPVTGKTSRITFENLAVEVVRTIEEGNPSFGEPGADGESFTWKGAFDTTAQYFKNDIVVYVFESGGIEQFDGNLYVCLSDVTGHLPFQSPNWELMVDKPSDGTFADLTDTEKLQLKGDKGEPGAEGPQGIPGTLGEDGSDGLNGEPGGIGPIGPQGDRGPDGPTGPQGGQGPVGPAGSQGPQGPVGADGTSVEQITGSGDFTVASGSGTVPGITSGSGHYSYVRQGEMCHIYGSFSQPYGTSSTWSENSYLRFAILPYPTENHTNGVNYIGGASIAASGGKYKFLIASAVESSIYINSTDNFSTSYMWYFNVTYRIRSGY